MIETAPHSMLYFPRVWKGEVMAWHKYKDGSGEYYRGYNPFISLSNGVGVIDSDYRGEIQVGLTNLSDTPYTVQPGDRIAQLVVMPVAVPELEIVTELEDTERGTGGFGSTGR